MKRIIGAVLLIAMAGVLGAQYNNGMPFPNNTYYPGSVQVIIQRYIHDGNQTYNYNLQGIKNHMEALSFDPNRQNTWQALKPILADMEKKQTNADVLSVVLASLGGATMLGGGGVLLYKPTKQSLVEAEALRLYPNDSYNQGRYESSEMHGYEFGGYAMIGGGLMLGLFGAFFPQGFLNFDEEIQRYINAYNRMHPDNPLVVR